MNDWHRGIADPGTLHRALTGQTTRISDMHGPRWVWAACGVRAAAEIVDSLRGAQCLWCHRWADSGQPAARDSSTTDYETET